MVGVWVGFGLKKFDAKHAKDFRRVAVKTTSPVHDLDAKTIHVSRN